MKTTMETESNRYIVQVFVGALSPHYEALSVEASKQTTSEEIVHCIVERLSLPSTTIFELAEVVGDTMGRECKERRLGSIECPVALMLLWPRSNQEEYYRFYLREKLNESLWTDGFTMDPQLIKDYFCRFLYQPADRDYPDLCQLPDLNEQTLLDNLRARFNEGHIYTYVGSILIAVNPFKFYPIYNPKYVKLYQNRRMGPELPPHIFAVADSAYHCMLRHRRNQCIVISGESGSGKTESTNFLLHHLTALSQKGSHGSGVEQTILSAGPVLEAFGNAKTAHNNNSSRFGKFIQVNYKENGMVHGAVVQKYLLEKSRICSQGRNERNYHVFYYLLAGASDTDRQQLHLRTVEYYNYLNKSGCYVLDHVDEKYEFSRLKQSMEMVGFTSEKQRRLFAVLSAVLLLGNVEFHPRKAAYHHDEAVGVKNPEVVQLISELLRVKEETLLAALTAKRARASGETLVINYKLPEANAARDAMAKCLYGALFDWIVLQVNHALLSKKDTLRDHQGNSIGVLDIFGFEDFGLFNSFEQFCINYANEHLQHYFNQHVFKYEQEEYRKERIRWRDIDFLDNSLCLHLIEGKPNGLLCVLDDQCNFPGASNETLLQKFNSVHKDSQFYEMPQKREAAFIVRHYAGKVKYQVHEMREKNLDLMRQEIVGVLKNSNMAFVRELVGADPVAVFRWAIVRAFFRGYFAFHEAGRKHRLTRDNNKPSHARYHRNHPPNDTILRKNKSFRPRERGKKGLKNLQSVKTLAGRTQSLGQLSKARKQPLTVTAQFQQSLHSLMDTLNQANPFFIRCIKSNSNKIPHSFDDETVQRQLRYTGMLETVRIRQAGYNVRLTYDEFIQLYRILLPKGLLSSQGDVKDFLLTLNLNKDNYQLGISKIFMRECEKVKLDYRLHQQIIASIVKIQRWFRTILERCRFLRLRSAVISIQAWWRMCLCQQQQKQRALCSIQIQRYWRAYVASLWYRKLKSSVTPFQAHARGFILRKNLNAMRKKRKLLESSCTVKESSPEKVGTNTELFGLLEDQEKRSSSSYSEGGACSLNYFPIDASGDVSPSSVYISPDSAERKEIWSDQMYDDDMMPTVEFKRRSFFLDKNYSEDFSVGHGKERRTGEACSDSDTKTEVSKPPPPRQHRRQNPLCRSVGEEQPLPPTKPNKLPLGLDLKRRNSDPAASQTESGGVASVKHAAPPQHSPSADLLEWKGTTMFTIAGHSFRKVHRFTKDDKCCYCAEPMDAFLTQGHKCTECKQLFHTKCIQNGGVLQLPCVPSNREGRRSKHSRKSVRPHQPEKRSFHAKEQHLGHINFNLTGTSEFTDSTDKIISDVYELRLMHDFITKKIYTIEAQEGERSSQPDKVFKQALKEFKDNLIATYSVVKISEALNIKYKDLIANFSHIIETVRQHENMREDFPVTMGVNAFRGFMNEFMSSRVEQEKPRKTKRKKDKKRKVEDPISHAGHIFVLTIINIPTACEFCSSFFMWPLERGLVCQNCKYTCHKKCYAKLSFNCSKQIIVKKKACPHPIFGIPLDHLISADKRIPILIDRLITTIEMYGLYTEGIYRKSGVNSKVKELKKRMEEANSDEIPFETYQVHVLTSVLKYFLREMPEPLLTFDSYNDFLHAANLTEDRVSTIFTILKKLPKPHFDLMERLIFHLARIALHESLNRMSPGALAIVFAPCILKTNRVIPAQESLLDIRGQTTCIEIIIIEQLKKVRSTLADIDTLDTACHTATYRLSSIRSSKIFSQEELVVPKPDDEETELMGKIEEIQKEKAHLTSTLPSLTRSPSDDDLLSTDDGSLDDVDTSNPQSLSKNRIVHKHKKRGSESSSTTFYSQDCDEDPIMV